MTTSAIKKRLNIVEQVGRGLMILPCPTAAGKTPRPAPPTPPQTAASAPLVSSPPVAARPGCPQRCRAQAGLAAAPGAVLDDVGPPPARQHVEPKAGHLVVPDEVLGRPDLGGAPWQQKGENRGAWLRNAEWGPRRPKSTNTLKIRRKKQIYAIARRRRAGPHNLKVRGSKPALSPTERRFGINGIGLPRPALLATPVPLRNGRSLAVYHFFLPCAEASGLA